MIPGNWQNVEPAKEGKRLPAGGYIARIKEVENDTKREFIKITFDIAEGPYTGYYADLYERAHFWAGTFVRSYKPKAAGFFRTFLDNLNASNPALQIIAPDGSVNELQFVGKAIGVIIGLEEYEANDGTIKTRERVKETAPAEKIRAGEFAVPELKRLARAETVPAVEVVDTTQSMPQGFDQLTDESPF